MVNTYPDIAIRPGVAGYPIVNQQTNGAAVSDAEDAAHFQAILDRLAVQTQGQIQPQNRTQGTNFALTKASGWMPAPAASTQAGSPLTASANDSAAHPIKTLVKNVWDVINPLQHIPVVGALYRHMTGDTLSPAAHFIGDALYGGPIGGAIAAADIAYQKSTGRDMGETIIASLTGGSHGSATPGATDTMVAQNLSQIAPAAGSAPAARSEKIIIWSDNNMPQHIVRASGSPLFPPSGTIGEGSASPSTAQPVLQANGAASTSTVQTQEAPAGTARKSVPPELIASRMMEGLQKYAQMKQQGLQQGLNPQMSELY